MEQRKIKIAIIEDSWEYAHIIANVIKKDNDCEVIGIAHDGQSGLRLIMEQEVDVALIEIVLPVMDGLYILEELNKTLDNKPVCVMLSDMSIEAFTKKALQLGADYFIIKPFDTNLMVKRLKEIFEFKNHQNIHLTNQILSVEKLVNEHTENDPEAFISAILRDIPIFTHLKGYTYLKNAVMLAIKDSRMLNGITKVLYPTVAQTHQTTPSRVERAIRHAIEMAWRKGYGHNYFKIIGFPNQGAPKPTNSQFIFALAELYSTKNTK